MPYLRKNRRRYAKVKEEKEDLIEEEVEGEENATEEAPATPPPRPTKTGIKTDSQDDERDHPSQISLSQQEEEEDEDMKIQQLERAGVLRQVVGSQSLLSQELRDYSNLGLASQSQTAATTPQFQTTPPTPYSSLSQKFTQEDEKIRELDKSGEFKNVVGSQSILSQELMDMSQRETPIVLNASQPKAAAQTMGLLTQEEEEPPSPQASPNSHSTDATTTSNTAAASPSAVVREEEEHDEPQQPEASQAEPSQNNGSQLTFLMDAAQVLEAKELAEDLPISLICPDQSDESEDGDLGDEDPTDSTAVVETKDEDRDSSDNEAKSAKRKAEPKDFSKPRSQAKRRKLAKEQEQLRSQELAQQAAALAAQTVASPEVAKNLLLNLALIRVNPRTGPAEIPGPGSVIEEGFFWAHYPALEKVLRAQMPEYYELSTTKCQSKLQQQFNNDLVVKIRAKAREEEWSFSEVFTDKVLRDRIR